MADDDLVLPQVPEAKLDDPEDVSWALSTAEAMWARGDHLEGIKWVRRAAEAASEAEVDVRALELAKAAADLAGMISRRSRGSDPKPAEPPPPPKTNEPPPLPTKASVAAPPPSDTPSTARSASVAPPMGTPTVPATSSRSVPPGAIQASSKASQPPPAIAQTAAKPSQPPPAIAQTAAKPSQPPPATAQTPAKASQPPTAAKSAPPAPKLQKATSNAPRPLATGAAPSEKKPRRKSRENLDKEASDAAGPRGQAETAPKFPEPEATTADHDRTVVARVADIVAASAASAIAWDSPTQDPTNDELAAQGDRMTTVGAAPGGTPTIDPPVVRNVRPPASTVHDPEIQTSQAIRVVVWRDANGVHIAPTGTVVASITIDAVLVALEPTADLTAWLSRPR